jgi:hypothetical protein
MPQLEVLVGMIASGKSTYARSRADAGAMVVCHDDLTQMLHARYRYEQVDRDLYRQCEDMIAFQSLVWGHDTVIDRTHLTVESRKRWLTFAAITNLSLQHRGMPSITLIAVVFPIEAAAIHAERRWATDSRGRPLNEWLDVARHHEAQHQAEPITRDGLLREGFDSVIRFSSNTYTTRRLARRAGDPTRPTSPLAQGSPGSDPGLASRDHPTEFPG